MGPGHEGIPTRWKNLVVAVHSSCSPSCDGRAHVVASCCLSLSGKGLLHTKNEMLCVWCFLFHTRRGDSEAKWSVKFSKNGVCTVLVGRKILVGRTILVGCRFGCIVCPVISLYKMLAFTGRV